MSSADGTRQRAKPVRGLGRKQLVSRLAGHACLELESRLFAQSLESCDAAATRPACEGQWHLGEACERRHSPGGKFIPMPLPDPGHARDVVVLGPARLADRIPVADVTVRDGVRIRLRGLDRIGERFLQLRFEFPANEPEVGAELIEAVALGLEVSLGDDDPQDSR